MAPSCRRQFINCRTGNLLAMVGCLLVQRRGINGSESAKQKRKHHSRPSLTIAVQRNHRIWYTIFVVNSDGKSQSANRKICFKFRRKWPEDRRKKAEKSLRFFGVRNQHCCVPMLSKSQRFGRLSQTAPETDPFLHLSFVIAPFGPSPRLPLLKAAFCQMG